MNTDLNESLSTSTSTSTSFSASAPCVDLSISKEKEENLFYDDDDYEEVVRKGKAKSKTHGKSKLPGTPKSNYLTSDADRKKKVRIIDVADLAGVSELTASRALRNYDEISDLIKKNVNEAADHLGYKRTKIQRRMSGICSDSDNDNDNYNYNEYANKSNVHQSKKRKRKQILGPESDLNLDESELSSEYDEEEAKILQTMKETVAQARMKRRSGTGTGSGVENEAEDKVPVLKAKKIAKKTLKPKKEKGKAVKFDIDDDENKNEKDDEPNVKRPRGRQKK